MQPLKKPPKAIGQKKTPPIQNQPPHDPKAEQGVIGSILIEPKVINEVASIVSPDDFYLDTNKAIYTQLLEMHKAGETMAGKPIDTLLLSNRLEQSGDLHGVNIEAHLGEVIEKVPVAAHAPSYAEIVRDKAIARDQQKNGNDIATAAHAPKEERERVVSSALENLRNIQDRSAPTKDIYSGHELMIELMHQISYPDKASFISTGIAVLDDILQGGYRKGQSIILAARPSVGKTAFACQSLINISIDQSVPTLFFSLEMSGMEIMQRIVCNLADVPMESLNGYRKPSDEELKRINENSAKISQSPFHIIDRPGMSTSELESILSHRKNKHGIRLAIIDQLDKLSVEGCEGKSDYEHKSAISTAIKQIARRMEMPIITLTQLNRESIKQDKPTMAGLRGTGQIEQDADVVLFLHRDENNPGKIELIVDKNRNGRCGTITLDHTADRFRFNEQVPENNDFAALREKKPAKKGGLVF